MLKSSFKPAMILAAAGSYAGAANATVFTQDFNLAFDPTTEQQITIGDAVNPQFSLSSSDAYTEDFGYGPKYFPASSTLYASSGSTIGVAQDSPFISANPGEITSSSIKVSQEGVDQYVQLLFQLDGQTYEGLADFDPNLTLKSVSYEVANGVPEPAVWMELILGLGLAGTAQRAARRRRHAAAAAL